MTPARPDVLQSLRRLARLALGILSPSVLVLGVTGNGWLDRWERRMIAAHRERVGPLRIPRDRCYLQLVDAAGAVVKSFDVTDKSPRNRKMRLNRWRRKTSHAGKVARLAMVMA